MGRRARSSVSEMPLRRKYTSALSVDRFSEHSLHSEYGTDKSNMCNDCMSRIPYATLIATIMCCLGVGVFCGTMYKSSNVIGQALLELFKIRLDWLEPVQMTFAIIGASMAALGFMILCLGCLATGATRTKVYRAWRTRVGGRISCAVFMTISYILEIFWILVFAFMVILTFFYGISYGICSHPQVQTSGSCIDFTQFSFLFPKEVKQENMKLCNSNDIHIFCNRAIQSNWLYIIVALFATFLVILSLIHYMMCLSANYAHIRDHEKFQELQDIQYLQDPNDPDSPQPGMGTLGSHRGKDRF